MAKKRKENKKIKKAINKKRKEKIVAYLVVDTLIVFIVFCSSNVFHSPLNFYPHFISVKIYHFHHVLQLQWRYLQRKICKNKNFNHLLRSLLWMFDFVSGGPAIFWHKTDVIILIFFLEYNNFFLDIFLFFPSPVSISQFAIPFISPVIDLINLNSYLLF